ncbi:MAG: hypothetical protein ACOVT5_16465 [Armatimonadaceae bacterium]
MNKLFRASFFDVHGGSYSTITSMIGCCRMVIRQAALLQSSVRHVSWMSTKAVSPT